MTDGVRAGAASETPVNPYSLLEAVNSSSETAHTAWLIFLAIMAYLMIAVAGVTHKDLLLETPVALPVLQVSIQQGLFFEFAPVLLVLFHLGIILQLVLLARKTLEFDYAVRALETTDHRTHPLRLELHNFFFVQAVAGPHRSAVMSAFLHAMSWLTLVMLPVVILLFIQVSYLPFHDVWTTCLHRTCLVLDIAMLVLIGVFLLRAESSFFSALWRATVSNPLSFLFTVAMMTIVAFFAFFVATVPGEALDRLTNQLTGADRREAGRDPRGAVGASASSGFGLLRGRSEGTLFNRFQRNLTVADTDLVRDKDDKPDDVSINLRGRDLRFAKLDRTDLHRADLTGANLDGASLVGTDLTHARLQCADITEFILSEDRVKAKCVDARGANFTRARLGNARMAGIDLRGAVLAEAVLESADLSYAWATGADFSSAHLEKADLTGGVQLQGANLLIASLQGADMFGAQLQGADLSSAALQGAILSQANLAGANLRDADLEAADMQNVVLWRADLSGAKVRAADLRGAAIWQTMPPARELIGLTDLSGLLVKAPDVAEAEGLTAGVAKLDNGRTKDRVREAVAPLLDAAENREWAGKADLQTWQSLVVLTSATAQDAHAKDLTEHLAGLMCKARFATATVATGIAKRAQGAQFRGNMAAIHDRLRGKDCTGGDGISAALLHRLSAAVDGATGR